MNDQPQHTEELEALFQTEKGVVAQLSDGRVLGPIGETYSVFSSLEEYRRFAKDQRQWQQLSVSAKSIIGLGIAAHALLRTGQAPSTTQRTRSTKFENAYDTGPRAKIFISYSRKDMPFADKLEAALKARGFEVLIDRQEIYAFEDWWKRIEGLIGGADTVVFVLSPDSVQSGVALKEVAHAASLNKRFAPIVYRPIEDGAVPEVLRRLNFIFFDEPAGFEASADELAAALQTNIGWIREHTEYGEAARRWAAAGRPNGLLLHSPTLEIAEHWIVSRPRGAPEPTKETEIFIAESRKGTRSVQRRRRVAQGFIYTLLGCVILGLVGWINQDYLKEQWRWYTVTRPYMMSQVRPYVLTAAEEQARKPDPHNSFRECAPKLKDKDYCPDMVVVPAGSFAMGDEYFSNLDLADSPQHTVTFSKAFAVSKFEVTFAEWDTCVVYGDCPQGVSDDGFGRGQRPVINVTWNDAQRYAAWLSKMTGKSYRLLSEAEYEYATRAGTTDLHYWGNSVVKNAANCYGCGSQWDTKETAPVGSFDPNPFGLYDMVGNVWEWTEDCLHKTYSGAPTDGSAWIVYGNCNDRMVRGGSWRDDISTSRSASRGMFTIGFRLNSLGFRLGRTLALAPSHASSAQSASQLCVHDDQQGDWTAAVADCTTAVKLNPKDAKAFVARCDAFDDLGNYSAAIADCTQAIKLDPKIETAFYDRAWAYERLKNYSAAIADYGQVITLDPKNGHGFNGRCWVEAITGQLQLALADCNQAVALEPNNANNLDSRGFTYLKLGRYTEAIADYTAGLKINPKHASSLYGRGVAETKSGDAANGDKDIAAAKALDANIAVEFAGWGVT